MLVEIQQDTNGADDAENDDGHTGDEVRAQQIDL